MTTNYRAIRSITSKTIHLGSIQRGLRTYCGKLLEVIQTVGNADAVTCGICQKTTEYQLALTQEQL